MEDEFNSRLRYLSLDVIYGVWNKFKDPRLNNVLEGFETDYFAIIEEEDLKNYTFIYVGNYNNIRGLTLKSNRQLGERDLITYRFSMEIEKVFSELNSLVVFNTFQSQLISVYENFGIVCKSNYIINLKALLFLPNKRGIDSILRLNILEFYRTFFQRETLIKDKRNQPKVYLMYDRKEDKVKIGQTKAELKVRKKGVAEPTIKASDPMIELITAWAAPKSLETKLHLEYSSKSIRGEWFDLRAIDLQNIDKLTSCYGLIDIGITDP